MEGREQREGVLCNAAAGGDSFTPVAFIGHSPELTPRTPRQTEWLFLRLWTSVVFQPDDVCQHGVPVDSSL